MADSIQAQAPQERRRFAGVFRVVLYLLVALLLWSILGWAMDFYVAATAEDRFRTAVRSGDVPTACVNAGIAADAYAMARVEQAQKKWQGLKADFCRR